MKKKEIRDKEKRKVKVQEKTKGTKINIIVKTERETISEVKPITNEEIEQQLTAIAFGMVKDRFGFEIATQEKIKALQSLSKIRGLDNSNLNINAKYEKVILVDDIGDLDSGD